MAPARSLKTIATLIAVLSVQQFTFAQTDHTQFIPSSAMMAVLSRPMDAIQQPGMELFPHEVVTTMGQKELGFDPCTIKKFTAIVDAIEDPNTPPGYGLIIEFNQPQKIADLSENIIGSMKRSEMDGKPFYHSDLAEQGPPSMREAVPGFFQFSDTTVIVAPKSYLTKMLSAQGAQSKLLSLIAGGQAENHLSFFMTMEPVRGMIKNNLPPVEQIPPMFRNFMELPDLIDSVVAKANMGQDGKTVLNINAASATDAQRMQEIMNEGMELGQQMLLMQLSENMQGEDPDLLSSVQRYVKRVGNHLRENFMPATSEDGKSLVFETEAGGGGASVATIGILTGMLLPAVQQVREAARRTDAANRLRQFALACHNHESAFRELPAHAIYSKDGKPLLSWRVKILPFIEENELYEKFHLDEPWDSEHNIKLLDEMPEIYLSPNSLHRNKTIFLALQGEGTFMDGTSKATRFQDITDGTSNTIMFVEADDNMAVEWTKPSDLPFDPDNPMRGLGSLRPSGFNAAFCDGSVHLIARSTNPDEVRKLAIRNDGEIVNH